MSRNAQQFYQFPKMPETHFLDNRIYTDEKIFADEQKRIYSKVWKFICHESEIAEINDYRTASLAGTPLVITRGTDGKVHTFVNACSHRGALIARYPKSNCKTLECVFHRWTYSNTTGELVDRPADPGFADCGPSKAEMGLREIRTEVVLGLVFINLDDNAEPIAEFLGDALRLQAQVLGTVELEVFDYYEQVLNANWKNWQETNLDLYHEYMHTLNRRTGLTQSAYYERKWLSYGHGHAAIEPYRVRYDLQKGMEQRSNYISLPGLNAGDFQLINLFPDLAINARGTVVRIDSQVPISPTQTLVQYRGLAIKGVSAEQRKQQVRDYTSFWGPLGRNQPEDMIASELQSGAFHGDRIPYTYWSRQAGGKTHDDMALRGWYKEWSRLMDRNPARPLNSPFDENAMTSV